MHDGAWPTLQPQSQSLRISNMTGSCKHSKGYKNGVLSCAVLGDGPFERCGGCQSFERSNRKRSMRGLGDLVERGLSAVGITKQRVRNMTGKDCGCAKRQAALNALLPFGKSDTIDS